MEKKSDNLLVQIIRWICVLPLSFIGAYLINWLNQLIFTQDIYGPAPVVVTILVGLISGYAFAAIGTYIAPKYKKTISILLSSLLAVSCIVSICLISRSITGTVYTHMVAQSISGAVGGIVMTVLYCKGIIKNR